MNKKPEIILVTNSTKLHPKGDKIYFGLRCAVNSGCGPDDSPLHEMHPGTNKSDQNVLDINRLTDYDRLTI